MSETVRIVQLYPEQLGVTGDRGNVRALTVRAERAGVDVDVVRVGPGQQLPADVDVIVIGNGPLSAIRAIGDDLRRHGDRLSAHVEEGGVMLSVGGSAELLSDGIDTLDGETISGLGLFPFHVVRTRERKVGYILVDTAVGRLAGFEDHASKWRLEDDADVFGTVAEGRGSFTRDGVKGELVRVGNVFATNVQGPLLPLNPHLTDHLLGLAAARRGIEYVTGERHAPLDEHADRARRTIERLVDGKDFSSIGL